MTIVHRVLFPQPIESLEKYLARGGGVGLEAALDKSPDAIIGELTASGLRGRGGAGFPTGIKWRTVRDYRAPDARASVVVNGAEGEPGTFKDRTILRTSPYPVIEGALIAARAVEADWIVFATKRAFGTEVQRLKAALAEVEEAGWTEGIQIDLFEGPGEYLYGEETALLETIDGRYPFPRVAPPFRRGDREVVETDADARSDSGLSAHVEMAGPGGETDVPPTLVDNVETLANVPRIIARGAAWFRTEGTDKSPGTIVCTVTGDVQQAGVGEVEMGTPLGEVIQAISGGPREGRRIKAVMPGVSGPLLTGDQLDTPVSYEGMAAAGTGLGSAGFLVFDDLADMTAVAAGASRFLSIESCGQCVPCKIDGMALTNLLHRLCRSDAKQADLDKIRRLASTVGERARCSLATQHQDLLGSILEKFGSDLEAHVGRYGEGAIEPLLIAELKEIEDGTAVFDEHHRQKQPDWSFGPEYSGKVPAERFGDHRAHLHLDDA
jgi:NADH:ubiquinone oxidoreductase subunit F (NADH-binding)